MEKIKRFFKDEEGVTAIEYGLIASLVAVAIITAVLGLGGKLADVFEYITDQLNSGA
jgi:pilus assembly protein Flp/PilA